VGVGEAHAFARQSVAMRRPRLATGVREIAVTQIVGKDENNIRLVGGFCCGEAKQGKHCENQQIAVKHPLSLAHQTVSGKAGSATHLFVPGEPNTPKQQK
jgi:hypothetical protein